MTDLRISIKNVNDAGGVYTTPFWFGFHDNSFDAFNIGQPASAGLEMLAEDGDSTGLGAGILVADADAQTIVIAGAAGPIEPGETTSATIDVDGTSNTYVNWAAMILPSNDAFIGNGVPTQLFSDTGEFLGELAGVITGDRVRDAGTEVNTETDAAFLDQTIPNTGVDENGVVIQHPGFNGSLGNPAGSPQNILGGTNALGEYIDPIAADFTQPDAELVLIHINTFLITNGTNGDDTIIGGGDDDIVTAGLGRDFVQGNGGWDDISGGRGDDRLLGNRGNDIISGDRGNDLIRGGADDDILSGGRGNDTVDGGRGEDIISGDRGTDMLRGGSNADIFVFANNGGDDTIIDFGDGEDLIAINVDGIDSFGDILAQPVNGGTQLDLGIGGSVLLWNVSLFSIDESDFVFT